MWHLLLAPAILIGDCDRIVRNTAIEAIADASECVVNRLGYSVEKLHVEPGVATELSHHIPKAQIGRTSNVTLPRLPRDCDAPGGGCRIRNDDGLLRLTEFDRRPPPEQAWAFRAELFASHIMAGDWHICPNVVAGTLAQEGDKWVVTRARVVETC